MEKPQVINLRRHPRCIANLKARFPGDDEEYPVTNISYKGCFVRGNKKIPLKKLVYFEVELPEVGVIPIYGVVAHHGTPENPGLGIEIVDIERDMLIVWVAYLKALLYIEDARRAYRRAVESKKKEEEQKKAKSSKEKATEEG